MTTVGDRCSRLAALWQKPGPVVMGIVNVTPDSFSDGGRYASPLTAIRHALELIEHGARIIDVGGESTRPGAEPVSASDEAARVIPVIDQLHQQQPRVVISVDTCKTEVAAAAIEAGADVVNDVTAGASSKMLELVAEKAAAVVLMHLRGTPRTMQADTSYDHVVAEVHEFLVSRAQVALEAGVHRGNIWLDPGIGFGKDDDGNLALLAAMPDLAATGFPVLVGPSRKAFIGRLTGTPIEDRLAGTLAALVPAISLDRAILRVHEPRPLLQFMTVLRRLGDAA